MDREILREAPKEKSTSTAKTAQSDHVVNGGGGSLVLFFVGILSVRKSKAC